jgi:hypothetical protein
MVNKNYDGEILFLRCQKAISGYTSSVGLMMFKLMSFLGTLTMLVILSNYKTFVVRTLD